MSTSDLTSLVNANGAEQLVSLTASQCASKRTGSNAANRSASTTRGGSPSRRSVSSLQTVNSTLSVDDASEILSLGGSIADDDWEGDDTEWLSFTSHCKVGDLDANEQSKVNSETLRGAERRKANIESTLRWMNEGYAKGSSNCDIQDAGGDNLDGLHVASRNAMRSAQLTNVKGGQATDICAIDALANTASGYAPEASTLETGAKSPQGIDEAVTQQTLRPCGYRPAANRLNGQNGALDAEMGSNTKIQTTNSGLSSSSDMLDHLPMATVTHSQTEAEYLSSVTDATKQHFGSLQSLSHGSAGDDQFDYCLPEDTPLIETNEPGLPHWDLELIRRASQPAVIINGSATITKRSPTHGNALNLADSYAAGGVRRNGSSKQPMVPKQGWSSHMSPAAIHARQNDALQLARNNVFGLASELASVPDPALVMLESERCNVQQPVSVVTRQHTQVQNVSRNRHSIALVNGYSTAAASNTDNLSVAGAGCHSNSTDDASSIVSSNAGSSTHSLEAASGSTVSHPKRVARVNSNVKPLAPQQATVKKPTANKTNHRPAPQTNGAARLQPDAATFKRNVAAPPRNVAPPTAAKQHSVDESRFRQALVSNVNGTTRSDAIVVPRTTAPAPPAVPGQRASSRIPAPNYPGAPASRLAAPKTTARSISATGTGTGVVGLTLPAGRAPHGDPNAFF